MNSLGIDRPRRGYVYFELWQEIRKRATKDDPQRDAAYAWERAVLGSDPITGWARRSLLPPGASTQKVARRCALDYLEHLWSSYSSAFTPFFSGIPYLRIGSLTRDADRPWIARGTRVQGHARVQDHAIYLSTCGLYREVLAHEVCHLLAWRDRHGPDFCGALLHLWQHEFSVDRDHALAMRRGACD